MEHQDLDFRKYRAEQVSHREPQVCLYVAAYPLDEGVLETVPHGYCKCYRPEYRQHNQKECSDCVDGECGCLEEHFQQLSEKVLDSFLHLVHSTLDIHSGGGADLCHTQLINLPVKFSVINEIGGGRILHHLFILQFVFLLAVLLHVESLTLQHSRRAFGDMTEFIVPSTTVGKNMMQKPITNGRSNGNTSIGSALASACHILYAT